MNCRLWIFAVIAVLVFAVGCSDGGSPTAPVIGERANEDSSCHYMWGLWQFIADPEAGTLDIVQLRESDMHINVLPFLEPPALVNLTLESLEFNGNIIDADIGLRHPFLGLTEFTGFDVCGILISTGSVSGFDDTDLVMAGEGDTRLLNPDGYARWWNPSEFPVNEGTIFSYNDGLLGAPDSYGNYNATINGYKYFCDDLDADDSMDNIIPENRGMFSPGQKNIRHYIIELGAAGLIFNYAVDANWQFPQGDPPYEAPADFGEDANRPEAYRIDVTEAENTLWNDGVDNGGGLSLGIDVYDWHNVELNIVKVESPGNFDMVTAITASGGDPYSTYDIEITDATPAEGEIELLITVESEVVDYGGLLTGETVSAYFTYAADVSEYPPATDGLVALADANYYEIAPNGTVQFNGSHSYDDNGFDIVDYEWDFGDSSPTDNGEFVSHQYTSVDLFYVTLTVENEIGQFDDDTIGIIVVDATGKSGRHLSATYQTGDFDATEENYEKRSTDHMYNNNYWIMQNGDDIVGFDMDLAIQPLTLNPVVTLATGVTGIVYSIDCGLDDRVAWIEDTDKTVCHIVSSTGVSIIDIDAPAGEEFWAADFDVDDDLWVVTETSGGAYWAHQYIKGDEDTYDLVDTWSHELASIAAAGYVFDIQVLHSTESMYIVSDPVLPGDSYHPTWPKSRIDVYDRFGDIIRSRTPSYWSLYPIPWPLADIELDSTVPALEACRLNWYQLYEQPSIYFCNSYRRMTLLLADISINFDQCTGRFQAMDLSNTSKRLESIDFSSDQYRYWATIPSDW